MPITSKIVDLNGVLLVIRPDSSAFRPGIPAAPDLRLIELGTGLVIDAFEVETTMAARI